MRVQPERLAARRRGRVVVLLRGGLGTAPDLLVGRCRVLFLLVLFGLVFLFVLFVLCAQHLPQRTLGLGLVDTDSERALREVLSAEDEEDEDEDEGEEEEEEEDATATDEKVVRGAKAAAQRDDDAATAPRGKPLRLHPHPLRAVRGRLQRPRR